MALMSSSRTCANNPYTSAATPQIKDTTLINCDTIVENMQFKQNLDRLYLDCGQLCQSDKTCTNCCKDNVHSDAFGKIVMAIFAVSRTLLSHCILKQLLVNHINCKDITDYTQSYHSRKATRQPTHFYNSKGTVGGEWNLTQQIGRSRIQWARAQGRRPDSVENRGNSTP